MPLDSLSIKGDETFPKYLRLNNERWGDRKVACRRKDFGIWQEYTWKDYYETVKEISLGLVSIGLKPKDEVAIIGDAEPEWYWAELAVQSARGIPIGLYTDAQQSEMKYFLDRFHCEFIFAHDQEQIDKVLDIKDELPLLKKAIYWDPKGLKHYHDPILISWEELKKRGREYEKEHPGVFDKMLDEGKGDDICFISPTSGTTGDFSKGAVHTHKNYIGAYKAIDAIAPLDGNDRYIGILPPAVAWEQLMVIGSGPIKGVVCYFAEAPETAQEDMRDVSPSCMLYAGTLWDSLASLVLAKISEANALYRGIYNLGMKIGYKRSEAVRKNKSSKMFWRILYAIMYVIVIRALKDKIGLVRVKHAFSSATMLSPESMQFFNAMGINVRQGYGSMEMNISCAHPADDVQYDTVGKPLGGVEVKISEEGEVLVKSSIMAIGYYNDPEKTKAAFGKDGWYHTGDFGHINESGQLIYLDRMCDVATLKGGDKYSPIYIESKLRFSPSISTAMVVGDNMEYVAAIINMDFDYAGRWAERNHVSYTTFADLSQKDPIAELMLNDMRRVNKSLPEHSQIKKYVLLHKELDPDEAELTRTWKVRRGFVSDRYSVLLDAIYSGKEEIVMESEVRYRDGRRGTTVTSLKIRTVA